jgi:asparagine synthase (glutamine-hydrolysing)
MCAVAGILSATPIDVARIFDMTLIQRHRGPDGSGHALFRGDQISTVVDTADQLESANTLAQVALGHRRLAILDRSPAARQPMSYANKRYWLTYNGEIYNYLELRDELRELGHPFHTSSDSEVVLAAFAAWGSGCFARLNGMWGMAIWDTVKRTLTLARDRFGEKPVYYSTVNDCLIFASEIKALFASGLIRPELNCAAARDFFQYETLNHSDDSFFANVQSLPAGSFAVVKLDDPTRLVAQPYWQLKAADSRLSFQDASLQFRALFESSVTLRMRSDVAVGSCLSGGLDSSAIACQMSRFESSSPINTFTSGSSDPRFDETRWANMVSDALATRAHHTTLCQQTLLDDLEPLIWHQEEPFNSVGTFAQWQVMRSARQAGVPVLLDGQGADEIMMGYKKFYLWHLRSLAARGQWISAANEALALAIRGDRGVFRWREGIRYWPESLRPKGHLLGDYLLGDDSPGPTSASARSFHQSSADVSLVQRQLDDLRRFSLPVLLRHEDRNSMAWSVETRVPFLDHRLVEFLLGLPVEFNLRSGQTKALLRRAFSGALPEAVLNRRDKMGYATPQSVWMQGPLGVRMLEELNESKLASAMLDVRAFTKRWRTASTSRRFAMQTSLFRAGVFSAWARRFSVQ